MNTAAHLHRLLGNSEASQTSVTSLRIHQLSALDAVASLKSTAAGLSRADVERRLHEFGRNEMEQVARAPLWLRLAREFTSFFSLTLWVAAGLAFFAEWSDPGQDMAKVGYAIVTVILVSGLFSFWQEYRVEQTLAALRRMLPQQAQVLREGKVTRVPAEQLVPGDIVHLEQGDNVPADWTDATRVEPRDQHMTIAQTVGYPE